MARKIPLFVIACLALTTQTFAQNRPEKPTVKDRPSTAALSAVPGRALMQKIMDAWATMNPALAAQYYDRSPKNIFFDDDGGVRFVGWQAYENGIRKANESLQAVKYTVNSDVAMHRAGPYAWGTATVHSEYAFKSGRRQVMQERWTLIWMKEGGNWLVVHEHFSTPAPNMQ